MAESKQLSVKERNEELKNEINRLNVSLVIRLERIGGL